MNDQLDDRGAAPVEELRRRGVLMIEQGGRGGVADYTGCLARALAERGLRVTLATAEDHLFGEIPGVRIVSVFHYVRGRSRAAALARRLGLGRVLNGVRFLISLPRLGALARPRAVIHVQGWERTSLGLIATPLLLATGRPIVYTAHNTFERRAMALDSTRIFPRLARHTIVHTVADRDRVGRSVTVIPHGHYGGVADQALPASAAAAREALGLPTDALVVLLFGVLRPDKGLDDLLAAMVGAPEWRLLIAGKEDGALNAAAATLARGDVAGRVTIREGFHALDAVSQFFAACDLVALPYQQASQSGVLYLAYGFARPVVAYPVGGLSDAVIDGETGWLCTEAAPAALAAALHDAAAAGRDEMRRRGEAGRDWARDTFDWSAIAEATEAVYASALRPQA